MMTVERILQKTQERGEGWPQYSLPSGCLAINKRGSGREMGSTRTGVIKSQKEERKTVKTKN